MNDEEQKSTAPVGRPLTVDATAESASQTEPAFIARLAGAAAYHGFQDLSDVAVDGFVFGNITDFEIEHCECVDAFVITPDNSRAKRTDVYNLNALGRSYCCKVDTSSLRKVLR